MNLFRLDGQNLRKEKFCRVRVPAAIETLDPVEAVSLTARESASVGTSKAHAELTFEVIPNRNDATIEFLVMECLQSGRVEATVDRSAEKEIVDCDRLKD